MPENTSPCFNRLQVTEPEEMTWDNDQLDRKEYAERLTTLIQNTKGPYVIGLTSPWGSGKTFFLQAWRHQLLEEKKPCIYFNAWEMDASGDPLINLMAAIQDQAQNQDFLSILTSKFKNAKWLSGVLNGAGKLTSLMGIPGAGIATVAANIVQNAQDYLNSARNFKSDLEKAAEELSSHAEGFPLFIMVDELDRCRPSYAIELLERIKHLFNVPHVVFLLAIDSTQLLQQVEHTFGLKPHEEDGKIIRDPRYDYLGKFFDTYYSLPPVENKNFVQIFLSHNDMVKKYTSTIPKSPFLPAHIQLGDILLSDYSIFKNKSLRQLTQDIEYFSLFIRSYDDLKIEDIILAFWAIFSLQKREDINRDIGILFENETNDYFKKIRSSSNKFDRASISYSYFVKLIPELKNNAFCSFILIKACMTKSADDILNSDIMKHVFNGRPMRLPVKKATDIADDVYERLQFLKDFHFVPQEEAFSQEQ